MTKTMFYKELLKLFNRIPLVEGKRRFIGNSSNMVLKKAIELGLVKYESSAYQFTHKGVVTLNKIKKGVKQ